MSATTTSFLSSFSWLSGFCFSSVFRGISAAIISRVVDKPRYISVDLSRAGFESFRNVKSLFCIAACCTAQVHIQAGIMPNTIGTRIDTDGTKAQNGLKKQEISTEKGFSSQRIPPEEPRKAP